MIVLGISPLDKDATVSIVADGEILFAAGEERFSRRKQHAGFPHRALKIAFELTGIRPEQVDCVAYAFLPWKRELAAIDESLAAETNFLRESKSTNIRALVAQAKSRIPTRENPVHGTIENMVRLGEMVSVAINVEGQSEHPLFMSISAHAATRNAIAPGENIGVSLRSEDIHLMAPRDTDDPA